LGSSTRVVCFPPDQFVSPLKSLPLVRFSPNSAHLPRKGAQKPSEYDTAKTAIQKKFADHWPSIKAKLEGDRDTARGNATTYLDLEQYMHVLTGSRTDKAPFKGHSVGVLVLISPQYAITFLSDTGRSQAEKDLAGHLKGMSKALKDESRDVVVLEFSFLTVLGRLLMCVFADENSVFQSKYT
jgi:hypothetical protein